MRLGFDEDLLHLIGAPSPRGRLRFLLKTISIVLVVGFGETYLLIFLLIEITQGVHLHP